MHNSLKNTLLFWFFLLSILPLIILSWLSYQQAAKDLRNDASRQLSQAAKANASFVQNWFDYRFMDAKNLAMNSNTIEFFSDLNKGLSTSNLGLEKYIKSEQWKQLAASREKDLKLMIENYSYIYDLMLIDTKGQVIYSAKRKSELGTNLFTGILQQSKLAKSVKTSLKINGIQFSDLERYPPSDNKLVGFITVPVINNQPEVLGVLGVQIRFSRIFELMRQNSKNDTQKIRVDYIVGEDFLLRSLINNNEDEILNKTIDTKQTQLWVKEYLKSNLDLNQHEMAMKYKGDANKMVLGIHQAIGMPGVNWVLISEIDEEQAMAGAYWLAKTLIILLLIIVTLIAIGAIYIARRIARPIIQLSQASLNIAEGKVEQEVEVTGNNEIAQLAQSFNYMTKTRLQYEEALQNSHHAMKEALAELSIQKFAFDQHAIISGADVEGRITFINDKVSEINGYQRDELIGKDHRILNSGVHDKAFFKKMYQTITKGDVWRGEFCNRAKDGSLYWVDTTIVPINGDDGKPQRYIIIRTDISDKKRIALTEKINKERLEFVFDTTGVGIWEWTIASEEFVINERGTRLLGDAESKEKILKVDLWMQTIHPQDIAVYSAALKTHLEGHDSVFECEIRVKHKLGHWIWVLISGKIVEYDTNKAPLRMIGTLLDISHLKHNEKILIKAKQAAESANVTKSEFLASMSHEIRTPINGVLGMLNLLLKSELNEQQRHKANLARSSADSLLTLINDILDFSKIEAGKLDLEILDFNLQETLSNVVETMALKAHSKGIEIVLDDLAIDQMIVKGDPGRLRQILINLIGNAIKFTEQGEIVVKASLSTNNKNELNFCCSIKDTGIGIPNNKIYSLFNKFTQVDATTTRKYGGTGLGLAICKMLCELMGGKISVSSEVGKGSNFEISILLQPCDPVQKRVPNLNLKGLNFLVVDDNQSNRKTIRKQIEYLGGHVIEAANGDGALVECEKQFNKPPAEFFTIAFIELKMPTMDGMQLGKQFHEKYSNTKMKSVLMTSMTDEINKEALLEIGFYDCLSKPVIETKLKRVIQAVINNELPNKAFNQARSQRYLQTTNNNNDQLLAETLTWPKDTRLLLVEDNYINQQVVLGILNEFGLIADVANNGLEAIQALKNFQGDTPYSLILMDCQMPEMDGYEATMQIRNKMAGNENIPIIALTANAMAGDKQRCLDVGMNDYLAKPLQPASLLGKLKHWLAKDNAETINAKVNPITNNDETLNTALSEPLVWDKSDALARILGKKDLLNSLLESFMKEMPKRLDDLKTALAEKDKKQLKLISHTIKGVSANLGAMQLNASSNRLEKSIKDDDDKTEDLVKELFEHYAVIKEIFEHELENVNVKELKFKNSCIDLENASLVNLNKLKEKLLVLKQQIHSNDYVDAEDIEELNQSYPITELQGLYRDLEEQVSVLNFTIAEKKLGLVIAKINQNIGEKSE